jgi:hypothetical protein
MFDLSVLPKKAQDELYDFYQFLVERYSHKKEENKQKTKSRSTEIKTFLDKYNLNLQNFSFNRDEIYER